MVLSILILLYLILMLLLATPPITDPTGSSNARNSDGVTASPKVPSTVHNEPYSRTELWTRFDAPDLGDSLTEKLGDDWVDIWQIPLIRGEHVVAFSVFERNDLTIHYMVQDGSDTASDHPILCEFRFLTLFRGLDVALDPIGISRNYSSYIPSLKTIFTAPVTPSSQVGYIVMGAHDITLRQYMEEFLQDFSAHSYGLENSILLGIELFEILEKVHDQQVVHGSISIDSFVTVHVTDSLDLRLIDWRCAYQQDEDPPCIIETRGQTPWEIIRASRVSYRDDVYRVFLIISNIIHGTDMMEHLSNHAIMNGLIFTPPGGSKFFYLRSSHHAYSELEVILRKYVLKTSIDARIDIIGIITELRNIVNTSL